MKPARAYSEDPRRLAAIALLETLFSPVPRRAADILDIGRELEAHPGIGFFKIPVPYTVRTTPDHTLSGFSDSMGGAVRSVIADLEALAPDTMTIVDIDAERLVQPSRQRG